MSTKSKAKPAGPSLEASMIAFERSIQISEGTFWTKRPVPSSSEDELIPIEVFEKGVRGKSSEDNAKNPGMSNIQTVDFASVPGGCNGVELHFNVRVLPMAMSPHACNDAGVRETYRELASEYARAGGFRKLAELYVWNIANSRFAWRNWYQCDTSITVIESGQIGRDDLAFNSNAINLEMFEGVDSLERELFNGGELGRMRLDRFIARFAEGLIHKPFSFRVRWFAPLSAHEEIFPSQEYLRAEVKARKDKEGISRTYAKLPIFCKEKGREVMQASMHSQKIGAALRHIDIWHNDPEHFAIEVNPYGGVQETQSAIRTGKRSFYGIRKDAATMLETLRAAKTAADIPGDTHFFMANLVRGGVFGSAGKGDQK